MAPPRAWREFDECQTFVTLEDSNRCLRGHPSRIHDATLSLGGSLHAIRHDLLGWQTGIVDHGNVATVNRVVVKRGSHCRIELLVSDEDEYARGVTVQPLVHGQIRGLASLFKPAPKARNDIVEPGVPSMDRQTPNLVDDKQVRIND
jgi:hypothetical protein